MHPLPVVADTRLLAVARELVDDVSKLPDSVSFNDGHMPDLLALAHFHEFAAHNPNDPDVKESYSMFIADNLVQFEHLLMKIEIEPWLHPTVRQPYGESPELFADLRQGHLFFFTDVDMPPDHPLAGDSGISIRRFRLTHNHIFRCIHDAFGHGLYRRSFYKPGEISAWRTHSQMYSSAASLAMCSETITQTAWFFAGPFSEVDIKVRPFAKQKAFLAPKQLCRAPSLTPANL